MDKVLKTLYKNKYKNINFINFYKNQPISETRIINDSVMMKGVSDEVWIYLSIANEDDIPKLIKGTEDGEFFFFEDKYLKHLFKENEIEWKLTCQKFILPEDVKIAEPKTNVTKLLKSDAEFIQNNHSYSDFTDIQYIEEQIEKGVAYGIRENNQLVAWALTHDDGAIGFLRVLPDHQGKGYAQDITNKIIIELRKQNEIPVVHIEEDNIKSQNLSKKVGFQYVGTVTWVKKHKKTP